MTTNCQHRLTISDTADLLTAMYDEMVSPERDIDAWADVLAFLIAPTANRGADFTPTGSLVRLTMDSDGQATLEVSFETDEPVKTVLFGTYAHAYAPALITYWAEMPEQEYAVRVVWQEGRITSTAHGDALWETPDGAVVRWDDDTYTVGGVPTPASFALEAVASSLGFNDTDKWLEDLARFE